jgi:hypothetical protein
MATRVISRNQREKLGVGWDASRVSRRLAAGSSPPQRAPLDSILTPTHLASVPSAGCCMGPGCIAVPAIAHNPPTLGQAWGVQGFSPHRLHHRPGRRQSGRLVGPGPCSTNAGTRSARAAWTPPRHRRGGTGLLKRGAVDSDGRTPVEHQALAGNPSRTVRRGKLNRAAGASRRAARSLRTVRSGARGAWRAAQVPTSGPGQGPTRLPAIRPQRVRP